MTSSAFSWFAHFGDQVSAMPEEVQDGYIVAVVRYGAFGDEPSFESPLLAACFEGIRNDIDNSKKNRNENKGGRPRKKGTAVKNQPDKPDCETGVKTQVKTQVKTPLENPLGEPKLNQSKLNQSSLDKTPYPLQCLDAFNATMGTTYTRNPHGAFLAGFDGIVPIEDVSAMIAYKRKEWLGTRFQANLTPSTLFSPDHFEAYLAQSKMPPPTKGVTVDDELRSYDG